MSFLLHKTLLLCVIASAISGCSSFSYYLHAINGHANILNQQQPLHEVVNNPDTSEAVRTALLDFEQAKRFAVEVLQLPDNDSYRYYADIGREYAVWNVIATPALSIEARQWCFLIAGCFNYRGFFHEDKANDYARQLSRDGFDTYVAGARAYSTLGWFDDPLLNTMLLQDEAGRIGLLFHELAHQKIYFDDDPAFNEAFAVFIEQEGVKRWLTAHGKHDLAARYRQSLQRRAQFHALLLDTRAQLAELYGSDRPDIVKRQIKSQLFRELTQKYQLLKQQWDGYAGYDAWMAQPLNNAHLALIATYREQVVLFEQLLACLDGDLTTFYQHVRQLETSGPAERKQALQKLAADCH